MTDQMSILKRAFLPQDLQPLLASLHFDGCVAVQARQNLEETRWLLELADQYDFIKGVVGWVDLCSDDLRNQLERFAPHPKLVGVRHIVHDEPDDNFMLRPDFRRGISQLRDFELTYDLLLFPQHLKVAVKLVEEFPEQPFVLDHLAKPRIARATLLSLARGSAPTSQAPQRYLQALCHGDGGQMESVAPRRLPPLPGHHLRGIWLEPSHDRFRLAGVHARRCVRAGDEDRAGLHPAISARNAIRDPWRKLRSLLPHRCF